MRVHVLVTFLVAAALGCNSGGSSSGAKKTSTTAPAATAPPSTTPPPAPAQPPAAPPVATAPAQPPAPPTSTPGQATVDSSNPGDPHMQYALAAINFSRAQYGLSPVALDNANGPCALRHAQDVWACANGQINMFSSCAHQDFRAGDTCNCASENQGVATGDNDPAFQAVHDAMMAEGPPPKGSINHFWVITNPTYKTVALGEFVDVNGTVWISEEWK